MLFNDRIMISFPISPPQVWSPGMCVSLPFSLSSHCCFVWTFPSRLAPSWRTEEPRRPDECLSVHSISLVKVQLGKDTLQRKLWDFTWFKYILAIPRRMVVATMDDLPVKLHCGSRGLYFRHDELHIYEEYFAASLAISLACSPDIHLISVALLPFSPSYPTLAAQDPQAPSLVLFQKLLSTSYLILGIKDWYQL